MTASGNNSGGGGFAIGNGNIVSGAGATAIGPGGSVTIVNNSGAAPTPTPTPLDAPVAPLVAVPGEVFISYSRADRSLVEPLIARLRGLVVTWWIDDYLAPGEPFDRRIDVQVNSCRAHIVAWSPRSVDSDWVRSEADKGRQRGTLVPILLEPCSIPMPFGQIHTTNLSHWSGDHADAAWRSVLDVLAQKLARPGLQELAALVQVRDGPGVREWATRYPDDPFVLKKLR